MRHLPTSRPLPRLLWVGTALLATLFASSCLQPEEVHSLPRQCSCQGVRCLDGIVSRLGYNQDEEADQCMACQLRQLGRCAEGCGTDPFDVPGCEFAYACRSWVRVEPGAACSSNFDCEPGRVAGQPSNTLACVQGSCAVPAEPKWAGVPPARECTGDPFFGPHSECGGAACLSNEQFGRRRYCSVARCLDDGDCPSGWFCRCLSEPMAKGAKATRWCVPALDSGTPPQVISLPQ